MYVALTRAVPPTLADCELTHLTREPIDLDRAIAQHQEYEALLRELGARVERVEPAPECPDSVFIEDTALVFDELAVMTRPGADSRRGEVAGVAAALGAYRLTQAIDVPGTLDGGDVLTIGRRIFVGLSRRTNADGVRQLAALLEPLGYTVRGVPLERCLHLKSAATAATDRLIVYHPAWIDAAVFSGFDILPVDADEAAGANVLRVGDAIVCPASAPKLARILESRGLHVRTLDASELVKAEAALTCCSLMFREAMVTR
ncbi:MAG: dimethylargininase [Vicinamibacterales bacterium]